MAARLKRRRFKGFGGCFLSLFQVCGHHYAVIRIDILNMLVINTIYVLSFKVGLRADAGGREASAELAGAGTGGLRTRRCGGASHNWKRA